MKKIFALFVMLFAFSISMNAQEKATKFEEAAKKDVELLKQSISLDAQTEQNIFNLFVKKHTELASPDAASRKNDIHYVIESKLKAALSDEKVEALKKNKSTFDRLVGNGK